MISGIVQASGPHHHILEAININSLIVCCLECQKCVTESIIRSQRCLEITVDEFVPIRSPTEFLEVTVFAEPFLQEQHPGPTVIFKAERSKLFEKFTGVVTLAITHLLHAFVLHTRLTGVTSHHGGINAHLAHVIVKDTEKDRPEVVILLFIEFAVVRITDILWIKFM